MSDREALAALAAREWELPAPELIRTGMNSLFSAGDDVVLRVGHPAHSAASDAAWHSFVSSLDIAVPRWLDDMNGPDGLVVVAMERVRPEGAVDWVEVGAMIRRLHAADFTQAGELRWCGDFDHWQVEELLTSLRERIDGAALAAIEECVEQWSGWREGARDNLVVCHGDLHPGNVIATIDGPVLIDWDLRCLGPAGWDHGPLLQWGERWSLAWGGGPLAYDEFAAGYGRSLRDDWLTGALAAMRMVIATLMRVRASLTDPAAAFEAEQRLRWWRGDPEAPLWEPQ